VLLQLLVALLELRAQGLHLGALGGQLLLELLALGLQSHGSLVPGRLQLDEVLLALRAPLQLLQGGLELRVLHLKGALQLLHMFVAEHQLLAASLQLRVLGLRDDLALSMPGLGGHQLLALRRELLPLPEQEGLHVLLPGLALGGARLLPQKRLRQAVLAALGAIPLAPLLERGHEARDAAIALLQLLLEASDLCT